MEQKYILSKEDVANLSLEQANDYHNFWNTVYDKGIVYKAQLTSFDELLQQQYQSGVLFNPNSLERYPEILAVNLQNVVDVVTKVRNDVINEKKPFKQFDFQLIQEGLESLKNLVNQKLDSPHYKNAIGCKDLQSLLSRIEQLQSQIFKDMQFYQSYRDEKVSALVDYKRKKEAYDKLSPFGKLAARINGKKNELDEARQKNGNYNSFTPSMNHQSLEGIVNPYPYDEYLEVQDTEQVSKGKGK